jgi:hypothetical protein
MMDWKMNKEQLELLDEAYERYLNGGDIKWLNQIEINTPLGKMNIPVPYSQEEFINKCKTNPEFSEKWGLKIEERELFRLERINVAIEKKITHKTAHLTKDFDYQKWCDEQNIPTKLIKITYNDTKLESYE